MFKDDLFEERVRKFLGEAQYELNTIRAQIKELQEKEIKLEAEVNAYKAVLQGYLKRSGKQVGDKSNWAELLKNQTHRDRLITIAKHNNGKIKITQAVNILCSEGFIARQSKRITVYGMVQGILTTMTEEGVFEKVARGEYKYVGN